MDTPLEDCVCHCPDLDTWTDDDIKDLLNTVGAAFDESTWYVERNGETRWFGRDIMKLLCGRYPEYAAPFLGDSMNSGATADPSFWPTHPNVDRLFQNRRMSGITNTDTWPNGLPESSDFYWGSGTSEACWGHQPSDTMIWNDVFLNDGSEDTSHKYTVKELWENMNPNIGRNWYVYDDFLWSHCAEEGYPIDLHYVGEVVDDDASAWQEDIKLSSKKEPIAAVVAEESSSPTSSDTSTVSAPHILMITMDVQ